MGEEVLNDSYNTFAKRFIDDEYDYPHFISTIKKLLKPLRFAGYTRSIIVTDLIQEKFYHEFGSFEYAILQSLQSMPEVQAEARLRRTTRTKRPDAMLSEVEGLKYTNYYGYGEVKAKNTDTYGKALDLARLAILGKDMIDAHHLKHILLFHIVG
ncbi:hypothetical protein BDA99DRAFT_568901 [Phascolomyces articulosus]|uniref:Uncharacterized protein n=1 Tax=Phascolomyces articulosus TaxID=60185 RepID=A0AAD5KLL3_9FUNG|nr:hypothetical protein BDA99DRAFT_568901 [Phascolomyces articulosus]